MSKSRELVMKLVEAKIDYKTAMESLKLTQKRLQVETELETGKSPLDPSYVPIVLGKILTHSDYRAAWDATRDAYATQEKAWGEVSAYILELLEDLRTKGVPMGTDELKEDNAVTQILELDSLLNAVGM